MGAEFLTEVSSGALGDWGQNFLLKYLQAHFWGRSLDTDRCDLMGSDGSDKSHTKYTRYIIRTLGSSSEMSCVISDHYAHCTTISVMIRLRRPNSFIGVTNSVAQVANRHEVRFYPIIENFGLKCIQSH